MASETEHAFEEELKELLLENGANRVSTFEEAGIMTRNAGLVVHINKKKFQLTIVEDRRGY